MICKHVEQEPKPKDIKGLFKEQQDHITHHGIITVQRMEPNAASVWVKYWRCQQMVKVYQHSCQKQQIHTLPIGLKKHQRNN